ncbi:hypothetical protein E0Z10_g8742 [Xylaria hypoxylon]|uniref:Uncharacterized protein n=1 Tax=Xylaria hypoxylon TaxID=37992 RepID=A0A4Z0YR36_9PEZI|nr:hypothetical protein E0Z10_g8742 [Xylaria hypoxylon]
MDSPPATPTTADEMSITEHINKLLALLNLTENIHVPVTDSGCSLECYKNLMELPVASTVRHSPYCNCRHPDTTLTREYIRKRYRDAVGQGCFEPYGLRILQEIVHELCEELDPEGGILEDVPDPRDVGERLDDDEMEGYDEMEVD